MNSYYLKLFLVLIAGSSFALLVYFSNINIILTEWKSDFYKLRNSSEVFQCKKPFKHILVWTEFPFFNLGAGNEIFVFDECKHYNCFLTKDRNLFEDTNNFDAFLFAGDGIKELPAKRAHYQKYIYANFRPSDVNPICHEGMNNLFNWTWSYKLDSNIQSNFISISDMQDEIIGPGDVTWIENMNDTSVAVQEKLKSKVKAAAWFVHNCETKSKREKYAADLQKSLRDRNMILDIYGECGNLTCNGDKCLKMLETDYYFYLSFEESFSEDYVTETLIHALNHLAIPIVYGGSNYTRYMPPNSYLNTQHFNNTNELADKMAEIINNFTLYSSYFRWTNHYKYEKSEDSPQGRPSCRLCSALNEPRLVLNYTIYENLIKWWNGNLDNCKH